MASTYTLISSQVLASSASSVTFSAIPATYTDLVVRASARSDFAGNDEIFVIRYNSDSAANYSFRYLQVNGSTAGSGAFSNRTTEWALYTNGNSATSNTFGNLEMYIPNYTSTSSRPYSSFGVGETNASSPAMIAVLAGLYQGTSAISSISFAPGNGTNWLSASSFYLYGISNA